MGGENIAALAEEILTQEGEARPIRQHPQPEVRVDGDDVSSSIRHRRIALHSHFFRGPFRRHQTTAVCKEHLLVLKQPLQYGDNLQRSFVGLVHHQRAPKLHSSHEGGVFPHNNTVLQGWGNRERLDG